VTCRAEAAEHRTAESGEQLRAEIAQLQGELTRHAPCLCLPVLVARCAWACLAGRLMNMHRPVPENMCVSAHESVQMRMRSKPAEKCPHETLPYPKTYP